MQSTWSGLSPCSRNSFPHNHKEFDAVIPCSQMRPQHRRRCAALIAKGGLHLTDIPGPNDRPDQRELSVIETPITASDWDRKAPLSIDDVCL